MDPKGVRASSMLHMSNGAALMTVIGLVLFFGHYLVAAVIYAAFYFALGVLWVSFEAMHARKRGRQGGYLAFTPDHARQLYIAIAAAALQGLVAFLASGELFFQIISMTIKVPALFSAFYAASWGWGAHAPAPGAAQAAP